MDIRQRWFAFLLGCIGVRLVFVLIARFAPSRWLPYLGVAGAIQGLAFLYLWLFNKRQTGFEAGGKIWWAPLRIAHSALYLIFAYLAINKSSNAYLALAADVVLGLTVFFLHHGFGIL